ncbi:hypothetical protein P7C70_g5970, partial [Phenoliferia sp. Uapishka_3]
MRLAKVTEGARRAEETGDEIAANWYKARMGVKQLNAAQKLEANKFMDDQRKEREVYCADKGISTFALSRYAWGPAELTRSTNLWNYFQGSELEETMMVREGHDNYEAEEFDQRAKKAAKLWKLASDQDRLELVKEVEGRSDRILPSSLNTRAHRQRAMKRTEALVGDQMKYMSSKMGMEGIWIGVSGNPNDKISSFVTSPGGAAFLQIIRSKFNSDTFLSDFGAVCSGAAVKARHGVKDSNNNKSVFSSPLFLFLVFITRTKPPSFVAELDDVSKARKELVTTYKYMYNEALELVNTTHGKKYAPAAKTQYNLRILGERGLKIALTPGEFDAEDFSACSTWSLKRTLKVLKRVAAGHIRFELLSGPNGKSKQRAKVSAKSAAMVDDSDDEDPGEDVEESVNGEEDAEGSVDGEWEYSESYFGNDE